MLKSWEPLYQTGKGVPAHKGQPAMRRPIPSELDRAHLTAQVALSDRLNLNIVGKIHKQKYNTHLSYIQWVGTIYDGGNIPTGLNFKFVA